MMNTNLATTRIADLCDLVSAQIEPRNAPGVDCLGLEHLASGRMLPVGVGKASDVLSHKNTFQVNDVLYGKLRPYLDKAVLAQRQGICTTELLVLRPKPEVDPRFLACVVHAPHFIDHAGTGVTGAHHPRTSWNHISAFELPQLTYAEQASVGALLWSVHNSLLGCEKSTVAAHSLKQATMRELFTRGLRGEAQKETEIGLMPESWDVCELSLLGKIGNGSTPKKTVLEYWQGGSYPWLTSSKVYDREIVAADCHVTDAALRECHLPKLKPGAVLMAITGQGKTLGHCAVLKIDATISQHIAYLQTDLGKAEPGFIRGYLETRYDSLRQIASGGGSTKGALTCAFLKQLAVPLPATLDEQREIVAILDALDRKIDLHRQKRVVLEELFRSLLHKLMTGEIRASELDLSALSGEVPV